MIVTSGAYKEQVAGDEADPREGTPDGRCTPGRGFRGTGRLRGAAQATLFEDTLAP